MAKQSDRLPTFHFLDSRPRTVDTYDTCCHQNDLIPLIPIASSHGFSAKLFFTKSILYRFYRQTDRQTIR